MDRLYGWWSYNGMIGSGGGKDGALSFKICEEWVGMMGRGLGIDNEEGLCMENCW